MAAATEGRFTKGDRKGWRWQVYADPSQLGTGYTRKIWNPTDTSNGGKPTESFEPYDFQADVEDDAAASAQATARQQATQKNRQSFEADANAQAQQRKDELDRQYGNDALQRQSSEKIAAGNNTASTQNTTANNDERMAELDKNLAKDREQFNATFGLDQAKLGASILQTASTLRGADNLVQGWGYAQGVNDTGLSPYVQAVKNGTATAYGGGTARTGNPAPATIGSLAASMSGQSYGSDAYGRPLLSPDKQSFVDDVGQQVQSGLANKPLGFFENMTPDQQKGFFSADAYNGNDANADLQYYQRSRPGQGSALLG